VLDVITGRDEPDSDRIATGNDTSTTTGYDAKGGQYETAGSE